jgi:hypothetical protein
MYSVVLDAYRYELLNGVTDPTTYVQRTDQLVIFMDQLRHGSREEFDVWYELYKDAPRHVMPQRKRATKEIDND